MLKSRNWFWIWFWGQGMGFGYGMLEVAVWVMLNSAYSLDFNLDFVPSGKLSMTPPTQPV